MVENNLYDLGLKYHHFAASDSGTHILRQGVGELIQINVNELSGVNVLQVYDDVAVGDNDQLITLIGAANARRNFVFKIPLVLGLAINLIATGSSITVIYR